MKHATMHELAKFGAGLVAADLVGLVWLMMYGTSRSSFLGIAATSDMLMPAILFDVAILIILIHYGWHIGKTPMLRERSYLMIAGTVFGIVAAAHLIRIFTGTDLDLMGWVVPVWVSGIGTIATAYLSYMSYRLALKMAK